MTSAPAVSRVLHKGGYGVVVSRMREGLLVTKDDNGATVFVQIDGDCEAKRVAEDVTRFLREQGFVVTPGTTGTILYVTRGEQRHAV